MCLKIYAFYVKYYLTFVVEFEYERDMVQFFFLIYDDVLKYK